MGETTLLQALISKATFCEKTILPMEAVYRTDLSVLQNDLWQRVKVLKLQQLQRERERVRHAFILPIDVYELGSCSLNTKNQ